MLSKFGFYRTYNVVQAGLHIRSLFIVPVLVPPKEANLRFDQCARSTLEQLRWPVRARAGQPE